MVNSHAFKFCSWVSPVVLVDSQQVRTRSNCDALYTIDAVLQDIVIPPI
jgi:hypothetical protein